MIRAFIQARMGSARFPGKVLAPLAERPVIAHVVSRVADAIPLDHITVATSTEQADDPLVGYVRELGVSVFRGPEDNVFRRFQLCLKEYPCDWFFRVCADSPLLDSGLLSTALAYAERGTPDLVTNTFPRTFPHGHSLEMLRSATFAGLDDDQLSAHEQEHLTMVYYNNPQAFQITNIVYEGPAMANEDFCVDTVGDLRRLEKMLRKNNVLA